MRKNVLLVVYNEEELTALSDKLQHTYKIYVARNIKEIQHIVECTPIQLIICTEEKPVMERGIGEKIKSSFLFAHIPVIFLTENDSVRTKIQEENEFVKKLNDCIVDNMHKQVLSVDYLARSMNMSRPTLYRKIKNITDHTPNELIGLARLKQAASLLLSTDYKVFEVAKMVGFNSQSTFGKAFLKLFKVTPTEYQRINKKF